MTDIDAEEAMAGCTLARLPGKWQQQDPGKQRIHSDSRHCLNERSMVSTKSHLMCGHRPVIGVGALIGDDKQKANQALAVQLRQLRFDGVDPIQELRLHIP